MKAYKVGELLGPLQLELLERKRLPNGTLSASGKFKCPSCGRDWTANISKVANGKLTKCRICSSVYDLTGQVFGRLTVLGISDKTTNQNNTLWKCQCSCPEHNIVHVRRSCLVNGDTQSCGCLHKEAMQKLAEKCTKDMAGLKIGHLTVLEKTDKRYRKEVVWKCQCDCKYKTIVYVPGNQLRSEHKTSCGLCHHKHSKGEEKIISILSKLNIYFEVEKTFDDCRNPTTNRKLPFDFYLPDYNCCIEYDGIQHFRANEYFGGEEVFEQRLYLDNLKNLYCEQHDIRLLRINYQDFKILDEKYILNIIKEF